MIDDKDLVAEAIAKLPLLREQLSRGEGPDMVGVGRFISVLEALIDERAQRAAAELDRDNARRARDAATATDGVSRSTCDKFETALHEEIAKRRQCQLRADDDTLWLHLRRRVNEMEEAADRLPGLIAEAVADLRADLAQEKKP